MLLSRMPRAYIKYIGLYTTFTFKTYNILKYTQTQVMMGDYLWHIILIKMPKIYVKNNKNNNKNRISVSFYDFIIAPTLPLSLYNIRVIFYHI